MKNTLIIIALFVFFTGYTQSNQNQDYQYFQKAFPKTPLAPTTYSFIRQGDIPVSEYTGAISFNLNLYTIEEGGLKLPITLSYVGGNGIKVNEEASWVGLGWNLTLPTISQVVNDFDDLTRSDLIRPDYFKSYTPLPQFQQHIVVMSDLNLYENGTISRPVLQPELQNGIEISKHFLSFYNGVSQRKEDIKNYTYDSEPDYFVANLLGEKVKFISKIDPYTNTLVFEALDKITYKIEKINNNNFKIIDDKGNKFFFEQKEEITNYFYYSYSKLTNRNWFVTRIETYDKNTITFSYQNVGGISTLPQISQSYNKTNGLTTIMNSGGHDALSNITSKSIDFGQGDGSNSNLDLEFATPIIGNAILNSSYTKQDYLSHKVITEINFSKGKIIFATSNRIDNSFEKLDKIRVENKNKDLIKEVVLSYDYFDSDTSNAIYNTYNFNPFAASIPSNYYKKRLKLISVNNFEEKPYEFEYNSTLLASKNSFARDYWGYCNGLYSNTSLIPNPAHFAGYENLGDNNNDLRPNIDYCKAGILEKISYPTGGKSVFEYELNTGTNFFYDILNIDNLIQFGNGLRVKSITNFDKDDQVEKYSYIYHNGKTLIPISFFNDIVYTKGRYILAPNPCANNQWMTNWCTGTGQYYSFKSIRSNNSISSDGFNFSNFVGYDIVDKIKLDKNNFSNGKIATSFYNNPLTPFKVNNYDMSLPSLANLTNENGNVLTKIYFKSNNEIVKNEIFEYNFYLSNIDYGIKILGLGLEGLMYQMPTCFTQCCCFEKQIEFIDVSLYGCYPIYSFETRLKRKREIDYLNGNPVERTTDYSYNNKRFLQSETTKSSDNTVLSKQTFYSFERLNDPNMNELAFGENNFSAVVDASSYRNGDKLYHFKNAYVKDASTNDLILTKEVFSSKGNNSFERKVVYDSYDDKGNITQYTQEKGIPVSIIWGYNKTEIIAKVENLRLNSLPSGLVDSLQSVSDTNDEAALLVALQNFRSSLSPNTMITTFTHKPLIGVSTTTDPKGDRITYFYDSYNRLKEVKDKDGNILSKNQYHFKN